MGKNAPKGQIEIIDPESVELLAPLDELLAPADAASARWDGRRVDTPENRLRLLAALKAGNTRRASCAYARMTVMPLWRIMKADPEFAAAVEQAESEAEVRHVLNIVKAAESGNWTASAWWLERRRPDDWGRVDRLQIMSTVRQLALAHGLSEEETEQAVQEADRMLKEIRALNKR